MIHQQEENKILETFKQCSKQASTLLSKVRCADSEFLKDEWRDNKNNLKECLLSGNSFLDSPMIMNAMLMNDTSLASEELSLIVDEEELDYSEILNEPAIHRTHLSPLPIDGKMISTNNSIHHLYHLQRHLKTTGKEVEDFNSIIEWGGGFGNFAKLMFKANPEIQRYDIIDIPEFSCLQNIYLSAIFGEENVNLITEDNIALADNKINLIPNSFLGDVEFGNYDSFVSTWALSESDEEAQQFCINKGFLHSENILLSFHQCGDHIPFMKESTQLKEFLELLDSITIEDVEVIPGVNYYAFR
jgi:hypothetical protein